ncbi:carbonic anhydrase 9-like [Arapaima gigas]
MHFTSLRLAHISISAQPRHRNVSHKKEGALLTYQVFQAVGVQMSSEGGQSCNKDVKGRLKKPSPGDQLLNRRSQAVGRRRREEHQEEELEDKGRDQGGLREPLALASDMLLWSLAAVFLHSLVVSTASSSSSSEEDESSSEKDGEERSKGSHGHWGYSDQDTWALDFHHCNGKSQSPINIDTRRTIFDPSLAPIRLEGYDLTDEESLKLLNNGHTLQLSLPASMRIISGFDNIFTAAQLHFHWGTKEVPGSEHTVDNVHFPAEIHVVHYNSKYANFSEAASKPDGLVVLGGFIQIGLHENENYEKILSSIKDVSIEESDTEIPGFNVRHLLPNNLDRFYRYNGSLTTPPCFQTVNWTIFNETIRVSRTQLAALEDSLKAEHNRHLSKNFRAPQLLHGRQVLSSFSTLPGPEGRHVNVPFSTNDGSSDDVSAKEPGGADGGFSRGDVLATAFGILFCVTLLSFTVYACQQRRRSSRVKKEMRENVIYKPATREDV